MPRHNTDARYGSIAKTFHWLTALLILVIIPLGIVAENMAYAINAAEGAPDQALINRTTLLFSIHKTLGVTVFFIALARIIWAIVQPHPGLLNGDNRLEAFAASTVHWLLYGSLVMVPLSGWVYHAATIGYAPIWWPFGQALPFVPKDAALSELTSTLHYVLQWVLIGAISLHLAGALKHHLLDGDATLRRMLPGDVEGQPTTEQPGHFAPVLGAVTVWAGVLAGAALLGWFTLPEAAEPVPTTLSAEGGNWQVQHGTLQITVIQMGADITGQFADWSALIQYAEMADETGKHGEVVVEINTASLTLGGMTNQATSAAYLNIAAHPIASFKADILSTDNGLMAKGDLVIREESVPFELPFELAIEGNMAEAAGKAEVDRRAFKMGLDVTDEGSLGFGVGISFALAAQKITGN